MAALALVDHLRRLDLRRRAARVDALLEHAHDVTLVLDGTGRVTFASSALDRLLGYPPAAWIGRALTDQVHPDDRDRVAAGWRAAGPVDGGAVGDVRMADAGGGHRWFDLYALDLRHDRHVAGTLLVCHEIGPRKALEAELARRARRDPLTGLLNRAGFADHLARLAAERPASRVAVLLIDLDQFKPVNDTYGHEVGDEVLRVLAARLEEVVRGGADGRPGDVVCRWGGDEFAVLLHDVDGRRARHVADRVLAAARYPVAVAGTVVVLGATVGIAFSAGPAVDPDAALRQADLAMYRAKEAGRGRYAVFDGVR